MKNTKMRKRTIGTLGLCAALLANHGIAQEEVERIRNWDYDTLISYDPGYTFDHEYLSQLGEAEASVAIESGAGDDIKKVTVSVAWKYKGHKFYRNLVTFVMRDGINKR